MVIRGVRRFGPVRTTVANDYKQILFANSIFAYKSVWRHTSGEV